MAVTSDRCLRSGFQLLLPKGHPRRTLLPAPPFPPPPLAAVLLLPPRHVPTPTLAPGRHHGLHRLREAGWAGLAADSATAECELGLADDAWALLEPSARGFSFGQQQRFELVEAAAGLLPEGCTLEVHPQHELLQPRHGTLVYMATNSGRFAPEPPVELL